MKAARGLAVARGLTAALGLAMLAEAGLTADAQQPVFSSRVEAVRVDVLVTDRGRVVQGLRREDFEVRDDGVLQEVDLVQLEKLPLSVILGFDVSESVNGERLDHLQNAGDSLLQRLTNGDRAALLTFSHAVRLRQELTGDISLLREALANVIPFGQTSLVDGTYGAIALAGSDVGRSLLIVFSDGVDTASFLSPEVVLQSARRSDVVVYGVAMRSRIEPTFLKKLGELTGGDILEIDSTKNLSQTFLRILEEFRQRYLLSFSPRDVSTTGWHRLDVRVNGRRATVKARAGYQAGR
jgi:Ca-activated chloride channel family protein